MHVVFALASMNVDVQVVNDEAQVTITQDYRNDTAFAVYGDYVVKLPRGAEVASLRIASDHAQIDDAPVLDDHGGLVWRHLPAVGPRGDVQVQLVMTVPVYRDEVTRSLVVPIGENPRFLYSDQPADGAQVTVTVRSDREQVDFVGATTPGVVMKVGAQARSWTASARTDHDLQLAWVEFDEPTLAQSMLAKFPEVGTPRTPAEAERNLLRRTWQGALPTTEDRRTVVLRWSGAPVSG